MGAQVKSIASSSPALQWSVVGSADSSSTSPPIPGVEPETIATAIAVAAAHDSLREARAQLSDPYQHAVSRQRTYTEDSAASHEDISKAAVVAAVEAAAKASRTLNLDMRRVHLYNTTSVTLPK